MKLLVIAASESIPAVTSNPEKKRIKLESFSKLNRPQDSFISVVFIAGQVSSNGGAVTVSLPSVSRASSYVHASVMASLAFIAAPLLLRSAQRSTFF